jgi:hypothetical protein
VVRDPKSGGREQRAGLAGCGVLVVNPPFALKDELAAPLAWLARALSRPGERARIRCWWLTPDCHNVAPPPAGVAESKGRRAA